MAATRSFSRGFGTRSIRADARLPSANQISSSSRVMEPRTIQASVGVGEDSAPSTNGAIVDLKSASVSFGGEFALRPTSLRLMDGTAAVVSGPSGCGKSTLLRVVAGLLGPSSGEVALWRNGAGPKDRRIGITLEEPRLWPWMDAAETVVCTAGLGGVRLRKREAVSLLTELNLGDATKTRVSKLSQGMARRVQLAGALAVGRDLLLLDEPTASLDLENGAVVWRCLENRRLAGTPIVIATHDDSWREHLQAATVIDLSQA